MKNFHCPRCDNDGEQEIGRQICIECRKEEVRNGQNRRNRQKKLAPPNTGKTAQQKHEDNKLKGYSEKLPEKAGAVFKASAKYLSIKL